MVLRNLIGRMLAIFLIVGLVAAPLVTPAVAKPMSASEMGSVDMTAGMPCCPDEPKSNSCQDCPLLAICTLKTAQAGPSLALPMAVRHAVRASYSVLNATLTDGIDRPPPDQPPRA
jgi:hypothetical protein